MTNSSVWRDESAEVPDLRSIGGHAEESPRAGYFSASLSPSERVLWHIIDPIGYLVHWHIGESRQDPGRAVEYMTATCSGIELYVEVPVDWSGDGNFDRLVAMIAKQARERGVDPHLLLFGK